MMKSVAGQKIRGAVEGDWGATAFNRPPAAAGDALTCCYVAFLIDSCSPANRGAPQVPLLHPAPRRHPKTIQMPRLQLRSQHRRRRRHDWHVRVPTPRPLVSCMARQETGGLMTRTGQPRRSYTCEPGRTQILGQPFHPAAAHRQHRTEHRDCLTCLSDQRQCAVILTCPLNRFLYFRSEPHPRPGRPGRNSRGWWTGRQPRSPQPLLAALCVQQRLVLMVRSDGNEIAHG
jgi:hypothetical protein